MPATGFVPRSTTGTPDYAAAGTPSLTVQPANQGGTPAIGSVVLRNPITGSPDYTHAVTPSGPVGTMNATISTLNPTAPKAPAPVVVTADAAQKNLDNIKAQVDQLTKDVAAHKAAMSTPQTTPGNGVVTPQNPNPATQLQQGPKDVDGEINDILNNLTGEQKAIDTTASEQLDPLAAAAKQAQDAKDSAAVTALTQLQNIASGIYPLSPSESALLDSTKASYLNTIQGQTTANEAYVGQMTELAASLGISTSAPSQAIGMIHAAISQGSDKVAQLNGQMAQSLATLQQGFQKQDYDLVQSSWDELAKYYDDRLTSISSMQKAVMDGAKQQKSDLMDMTKLTLSTMMDSAKFTYQQKQDAIDNAFKAGQITETHRHNLETEATAQENADNSSNGTGGGNFTKTQLNKGAANAAVDMTEFGDYPADVKNYYINNPTQAKAFNQLISDRAAGKTTAKDVADTISSSGLPDDVMQWMYQKAGVDENGNPTDGKQDSSLLSGLSEAGDYLGNSYDSVKSWLGIE